MRGVKRLLAVLVVLAGLIGGAVGLYDALTAEDSVLDTAAEEIAPTLGASVDEVRALLDQAIDAGEISISISIGLYIVIGGGVLALVGGLLSMRGGREPVSADTGFTPAAPSAPPTTPPTSPPAMPPAAPPSPPAGEAPPG
jgi:hypothetical protein